MTRSEKRRSATRDSLASRFELPLLGSNQDSPDPESGVLPVTPRGSTSYKLRRRQSARTYKVTACNCATWRLTTVSGAEGARTPGLLGAIQALSQLSYSPVSCMTGP